MIEKNGSVKSDKYPYEEISVIGKGLWLARGKEGLVVAKHVKCPQLDIKTVFEWLKLKKFKLRSVPYVV